MMKHAFKKAVTGMALLVAGCGIQQPKSVNDNFDYSPNCEDGLKLAFNPAASPVLLGERVQPIYGDDGFKAFSNWTQMLGRQTIGMNIPGNDVVYEKFMSQFDQYRDRTIAQKVDIANDYIKNNFKYETDDATYGKSDYWATPLEIIARGQGDCEDLNTLKYTMLRRMGVPMDKMYIAVMDDAGKNAGGHMVLIINMKDDVPGQPPIPPAFAKFEVSETFAPIKRPEIAAEAASAVRDGYTIYYAMNEGGVYSVPANANTVDGWGNAPPPPPPGCLKMPEGAIRTLPSLKTTP